MFMDGDLRPGELRNYKIDLSNPQNSVLTSGGFIDDDDADVLGLDDAIEQADRMSSLVLLHFRQLRNVLDRYEDLIRKRWAKKNGEQRRKILCNAWPIMPARRRPDIEAYRRKITTRFRECYLWPSLNQEELSHGSILLHFLNSRGRHEPAVFAANDLESIRLGNFCEALTPEFIEGYYMDLESEAHAGYGSLYVYVSSPENRANGKYPNTADGFQILEIQEHILSFLVDACQGILHEKDLDSEAMMLEPVLPEPPSLTSAHTGERATALDLARESPYLVPRKVDLRRIHSLASTRHAEWKDHGWAMREDPGFYAEVAREWYEHQDYQLLDARRKPQSIMSTALGREKVWDQALASAVAEVYQAIYSWGFISQQLRLMMSLAPPTVSTQDGHVEATARYQQAMKPLKYLLDRRFIMLAEKEVNRRFTGASTKRSVFSMSGDGHIQYRGAIDEKDDLIWYIRELASEESQVPHDILAAELNRTIQGKNMKERLTPLLSQYISDLALLCELRTQLRLLSPNADAPRDIKDEDIEQYKEVANWCNEWVRPMHNLMMVTATAHAGDKFLKLGNLGETTSGKFSYPVHKRRTKESTIAMQMAEQNLDKFWDAYDRHMRFHLNDNDYHVLQCEMPKREELQRTAN
ncbi:hypothetical protein GGR57DRAFT_480902 [Xylariaceae sp. FL1272]|nr:hypothetical protein GGR57DRAFT_480902 [Xylariaceae sp. FL1272]